MYRPSSARAPAPGARAVAAPKPPGGGAAPGGGAKRMSLGDFDRLVTVAKGSFGVVYKAGAYTRSLQSST